MAPSRLVMRSVLASESLSPESLSARWPQLPWGPLDDQRELSLVLRDGALYGIERARDARGEVIVRTSRDDDPSHSPAVARIAASLAQHLARKTVHDVRGLLFEPLNAFELLGPSPIADGGRQGLEAARLRLTQSVERLDSLSEALSLQSAAAVVYPTVYEARAVAARKGAKVTITLAAEGDTLVAPRNLDAALRLLLENAFHHGRAKEVELRVDDRDGWRVFAVRDNGTGIGAALWDDLGALTLTPGHRRGFGLWFSVQMSDMLKGGVRLKNLREGGFLAEVFSPHLHPT